MSVRMGLLHGLPLVALAIGVAAEASATTLMRASLDELAKGNSTIVVGEVLDDHSYWNEDRTFILTDVRVAVHEVLKGQVKGGELTLAIMGGKVDGLVTLIVGGADLRAGNSYVLFLDERSLPGLKKKALTVSDHCQGVFDLVPSGEGLRAVSQANRHPLVPDHQGSSEPPGGVEGLELDSMMRSVRREVR